MKWSLLSLFLISLGTSPASATTLSGAIWCGCSCLGGCTPQGGGGNPQPTVDCEQIPTQTNASAVGTQMLQFPLPDLPHRPGEAALTFIFSSGVFQSQNPNPNHWGNGWSLATYDNRIETQTNKVTEIGPDGRREEYTFDGVSKYKVTPARQSHAYFVAAGNDYAKLHPDGNKEIYDGSSGRLKELFTWSGQQTVITRSADKIATIVTPSLAYTINVTYGSTTTITNGSDTIELDGSISSIKHVQSGKQSNVTYKTGGIGTIEDIFGRVTEYWFTSNNLLSRIKSPDVWDWYYSYQKVSPDPANDLWDVFTLSRYGGYSSRIAFNGGQCVVQENRRHGPPPGFRESVEEQETPEAITLSSAMRSTTYLWDAQGRLAEVTTPDGRLTKNTYDGTSGLLTKTEGPGQGEVTDFTYAADDPFDRPQSVTKGNFSVSYDYTGSNDTFVGSYTITNSAISKSTTTAIQYTGAFPTAIVQDGTTVASMTWDTAKARVLTMQGQIGPSQTFTYDQHGHIATADIGGQSFSYTRDVQGRPLSTQNLQSGVTENNTYASLGYITSSETQRNGFSLKSDVQLVENGSGKPSELILTKYGGDGTAKRIRKWVWNQFSPITNYRPQKMMTWNTIAGWVTQVDHSGTPSGSWAPVRNTTAVP